MLGISLVPSKQAGKKVLFSPNCISWKAGAAEGFFDGKILSYWEWKTGWPQVWATSGARNMNHQLDVAQLWDVDWVHFIWTVSPRTSPQWSHLPFAEQPSKAPRGRTKCLLIVLIKACNVTLLPCTAWNRSFPQLQGHICLRWTPVKAWSCANLNRMFVVYCHLPAGPSWCAGVLLFLTPSYGCAEY